MTGSGLMLAEDGVRRCARFGALCRASRLMDPSDRRGELRSCAMRSCMSERMGGGVDCQSASFWSVLGVRLRAVSMAVMMWGRGGFRSLLVSMAEMYALEQLARDASCVRERACDCRRERMVWPREGAVCWVEGVMAKASVSRGSKFFRRDIDVWLMLGIM